MITSGTTLRYLKVFHLITASIWFGGVACLTALVWVCFFELSEKDFLVVAPMMHVLYVK